jgi:glycosyltransferase involved in cell wall biosynthesis
MKIALFTDTNQSAIWRLARGLKHPDFQFRVTDFHPKKPNPAQMKKAKELFRWADLVHIQYWKTGAKIRETFREWGSKPKLLTHYNPYNLHEEDWNDYKQLIVVNQTQHKGLPKAKLIPLCTDLKFFHFNQNYTNLKTVNMSVNRIEGKKGVKEVAQACKELGYKFLLVGRVSKRDYCNEVIKAGGKFIKFTENVTDLQLRDKYHASAIHVCNSVDRFESGTLPILECMASGVPVVSRRVGHVPDLYNGKNLKLLEGRPNDVEGIKKILKHLMENHKARTNMRNEAIKTVAKRGYNTWSKMHAAVYKGFK